MCSGGQQEQNNSRLNLKIHIKKATCNDQVRCSPGMQFWFNMQKSNDIVYHRNIVKDKSHDYQNRFLKKHMMKSALHD